MDQEPLQGFDCGDERFEQEVNNWIRDWIWQGSEAKRRRTLLAVDNDAGLIAGFGSWAFAEAFGTEPVDRHLEIAWFGIDKRYHGVAANSGARVSDLVYASVERKALADQEAVEDMPLTLTCHVDNLRGRCFWERQGYQLVGPPYAEVEKERYHRMVR